MTRPLLLAAALLLLPASSVWPQPGPAPTDPDSAKNNPAERNPESDSTRIEFFEKHIRPLLIDQCMDCHGADLAESGLRMDSRAGLLRGGERGPAIVPGEAEESLLIRAVRHSETLQMPPKQKLSTAQIAVLAQWIADGAAWPGTVADPALPGGAPDAPGSSSFTDEQKSFWAFQPVTRPAVPEVSHTDRVQTPVDAFILSRLEAAGREPAPLADRRTLIRRVSFDLTGLPPTHADVEAFAADESPDAVERLIDRLLMSPHYGEKWGRHWLDVARYADSNGLDENLAYANAFRYRDYVVSSFNSGKPFDRFIQEQLAGDLLDASTTGDPFEGYIATGFLCIGSKMLAEDDPVKMQMDIIDEQIDTLGQAVLGLTFGCARCHDHKFDPLTLSDYYGLAGIFKSTQTMDTLTVVARWHERDLATPEAIAAREAHQKKIDAVGTQISELRTVHTDRLLADARRQTGRYLLAAESQRRINRLLAEAQPLGDRADVNDIAGIIQREAESFDRGNVSRDTTGYGAGIGVLVNKGQQPNYVEYDITVPDADLYQLEVRYAAASSRPTTLSLNGAQIRTDIADGVTGTWYPDSQRWEIEGFLTLKPGTNVLRLEHAQFFPHIDRLLLAPAPESAGRLETIAAQDSRDSLIPEFVQQWAEHLDQAEQSADRSGLPSEIQRWLEFAAQPDSVDELRRLALSIADASSDSLEQLVAAKDGPFRTPDSVEARFPAEAVAQLKDLRAQQKSLTDSLPKFPATMSVADAKPEDIRIHYRGSHLTQGPVVPRQFPAILSASTDRLEAPDSSGRLALARWLTDGDHPLTARVFVNRMWNWHFGTGLVRTPDNFGRLGERPTHPELLDWLADEFVASGWSIRHMHRLMLGSSTWQQMARTPDPADPDNLVWAHMNRRRLLAEEIRDAVLSVSGQLDPLMRGTMLPTANRAYVTSTANVNPVVYVSNRRSIYLPVVRSALFEVFQAFDFADPSALSGARQSTTVAPQALFMLNSSLVASQSRTLAEQLLEQPSLDDTARIRHLWQTILLRDPDPAEQAQAVGFLNAWQAAAVRMKPDSQESARTDAWRSLARALIASNEFVFID